MLRPGDWITMSKYGADGYVIEVTLTTVKVQNFDKTITTIPPYALVSDSFQNWRGMRECADGASALGLHRRPHDSPVHAGRDGAAPRKGVSCGRYIAGNRQPASAAGVSRELPEQLPRRAQRPDVDGTHAPTHVRRRAFGVLLLHAPLRMDSLRSVPERTYRPRAHLLPVFGLQAFQRPAGTICMNGTDGIRTLKECLFSDAKRAHSPRRSVSLQRFFRKRCEIPRNTLCLRAFLPSHGANVHGRRPDEGRRGRTPSPPYRILCLRTETHADIAHEHGIKAHVCRCMRRIGIATAGRPLLRIHRRKERKGAEL